MDKTWTYSGVVRRDMGLIYRKISGSCVGDACRGPERKQGDHEGGWCSFFAERRRRLGLVCSVETEGKGRSKVHFGERNIALFDGLTVSVCSW